MKKLIANLSKYNNIITFLLIILFCGFVCGIFLVQWLDESIISMLSKSAFSSVIYDIDRVDFFTTQFVTNILICTTVLFFGFSIVGIPFIGFVIFTKGVQIGFSCCMYLITFELKGMLGILCTLIPQVIFDSLACFIICVISLELSFKLFKRVFFSAKVINFKEILEENLNGVIISFSLILFSSIIKSTIVLYLMDWFKLFSS